MTLRDCFCRHILKHYVQCNLLGTLTETGLARNTIFIFSSNHGETLGAQGVAPHEKQVVWNESAHVPFLMRMPGVKSRTVATPITTPDILPTLLGLAGVKIPATIKGEDLSALFRAGRDADRAALYMSVKPFNRNVPPDKSREYRAIRTSQYTYARSLEGPWLLFDDQADPFQTKNLADKPEHAALVHELDGRLQSELKRVGDDFRPGESYVAEFGYRLAPHGSIPYSNKADAGSPAPQTPRRKVATQTPASEGTKN